MLLHDLSLIITAIAIIGNLALGILVLHHDPKNKTNQTYFVFILFLVVWMISSYIVDENIGAQLQKLSLRIAFVSGLLSSYYLFKFSLNFPRQEIFRFGSLPKLLLKTLVVLFAFLAAFTNLIIIPIEPIFNAYFYKESSLYPVYAIFLVILLFCSIYITIRNYKSTTGKERLQLAYLIWGLTIPIFFISILTLIAPIFTPNSSEYEFSLRVPFHRTSLISISIYVVAAAYAIIRHRLFGIRVILGELLFWLAGAALTFIFFYATVLAEQKVFDSFTDPLVIALNVLIALVVFPLLRSANNRIRRAIRKFSINVSFDQEHVLKDFNAEITQAESTSTIIERLFAVFEDCYSPSCVGILLIDRKTANITSQWNGLTPEEIQEFEHEDTVNTLINSIGTRPDTLQKIDAILPLTISSYDGVCVLGPKKGRDTYTTEDIQFIEKLLQYTGLNLNRTLQ